MQQLGLDSKSKPKESSRIKDVVWPELKSRPAIESAADLAKWAAFLLAALVAVVGLLNGSIPYLLFALIYLALGRGFSVKNRVAAAFAVLLIAFGLVSQLMVGLLEMGAAVNRSADTGGFVLLMMVRSFLLPGIAGLLFLNGLRAAIAYHRLSEKAAC